MNSDNTTKNLLDKIALLERKIESLEIAFTNSEVCQYFFNASKDMICIAGTDGYFKTINPAFSQVLGYTDEELLQNPFFNFIHPDDLNKTSEEVETMSKTGATTNKFQNRYITKQGEIVFLEWNTVLDNDNKIIYAIARDVTDKKNIEEKIKGTEQLMIATQKIAKMGSWSFEIESYDLYWTDELYSIFEIEKDTKELYQEYMSRFSEKDLNVFNSIVDLAITKAKPYNFQHKIHLSDGRIKWVYCSGIPIQDENNKVIKIEGVVQDITANKKAQEELMRSEKLLNESQSISKLGSFSFDLTSYSLYWSNELYTIFEITNEANPNLYNLYLSRFQSQDKQKLEILIENAVSKGETYSIEHAICFSDGREKWILEIGIPIKDDNGKVVKLEGVAQDITELKKSQFTILNNVNEKETLIKELHHRVKNNMQVITSLLNLQSNLIEDPMIKNLFHDSQLRIKSMAIVHDLLYKSDNISKINFSQYIKTLIDDLIFAYKGSDHSIKTDIQVPDILFSLDTAVPLGLLVNEIITNSLKHGLKDNNNALISCAIKETDDAKYTLQIKDNGTGFERKSKNTNETLGLLIIESLANQIDGELIMHSDDSGTEYQLIF